MKALVLEEYGKLVYREAPQPSPAAGEVLVRVKACGICGSDVHGMDGSTGRRIPPVIMGHEASGVIEALGAGVEGWRAGQRVTFDSTVYCGKCWHCRRGEINLCDHRRVLGVSCDEYRQDGAFAEYVVVPQHVLYALPEQASFEQAAMVEPLSVAMHAAARTAVHLDDTAVVLGAGMIGLMVVQCLRAAGCGTILAADVDDGRLERARTLGADLTVNTAREDLAQAARGVNGRGADVAVEAIGLTETVQAGIAALRKGGTLTLVGNFSPEVQFALQKVVTREITVYGSCASRGEYPACLDFIARGTVKVDSLVSAVAPLSEGAGWFSRLYDREQGLMKVILTP